MAGEKNVEGVLWAALSLTVLKTVLVAGALCCISSRGRKLVRRVSVLASRSSQATPAASPPLSPSGSRKVRGQLKSRSVHRRLLLMHLMAMLAQLAGIGQYVVSVTDAGCVAAHRVMMASLVLFDGTIVLFLLAKTQVTNNVMGGSAAATKCWEHAVRRFSLFWAWVCLPATAVICAVALPGGISHEDGGCHGGIESFTGDDSTLVFFVAFTTGKVVLIIELMLLLALFVKPLFARGSDGLIFIRFRHRRTVVRNTACTVGVVLLQLAETVVVYTVVYHKGSVEQVERIADVVAVCQAFFTLCLTEVTIPLGFTSFFAWARSIWMLSPGRSDGFGHTFTYEAGSGRTRRSTFFNTTTRVKSADSHRSSVPINALGLRHAPVNIISEERESVLESSGSISVISVINISTARLET